MTAPLEVRQYGRASEKNVGGSMKALKSQFIMGVMIVVWTASGCLNMDRTLHYFGKSDLKYYKQVAQQVDYPFEEDPTPSAEATESEQPRTIQNRRKDEIREMSLMETIHTALANNRIIRSRGTFLSAGNSIYTNANGTPSTYDPAIQETGVLFGGRGLEAALADFDTTFTTNMTWGRSENVQNNAFFSGGLTPGSTLMTDSGRFRSAVSKQFTDGGSFVVGHDWDYTGRNSNVGQLFSSVYTGNMRAQYRRPLWAGAGTEYSRIAGPRNQNFGAITGVSQGVVIARINNDISITRFQMSVRNLVKDVEDLYWELHLSYRLYDTTVAARQSAQESWRVAKSIKDLGGVPGFDLATEPQARSLYFESRAAAESALTEIYNVELRLRRLLGLRVNDGTIIRPSDEPIAAELAPDWTVSLTEALMRRAELRNQKWNIKSLQLQLKAAQSLIHPRFDFVSSYQVNAFGDSLFGQNDNDGQTAQGLASAYETLTQGNQTGWTLGFEFSMPFGFRSARAQVRNYELRLAKAHEVLATQELEISHELADAFQNLARHFANVRSNFERRRAERERVTIYQKREGALATADIVLRAIRDRASADAAYYRSLIEYNKAITNLEYRKGTLLDRNGILLAENEWTPEAYEFALRRAEARSAAIDNKLLHTEPMEFVVPPGQSPYGYIPADDKPIEEISPKQDHGQPTTPPPAPSTAAPARLAPVASVPIRQAAAVIPETPTTEESRPFPPKTVRSPQPNVTKTPMDPIKPVAVPAKAATEPKQKTARKPASQKHSNELPFLDLETGFKKAQ